MAKPKKSRGTKHTLPDTSSSGSASPELPLKRSRKIRTMGETTTNTPHPRKVSSPLDTAAEPSHSLRTHQKRSTQAPRPPQDSSEDGSGNDEHDEDLDEDDIFDGDAVDEHCDQSRKKSFARMADRLASEMPTITSPRGQHTRGLQQAHNQLELRGLPQIAALPVPQVPGMISPPSTNDTWPADTDIIRPQLKNGHLRLREQSKRVRDMYWKAMPIIWYEFCTKYALPDADDSRGWIRDTLATAAFHLGDTDLENRIHDDESYGQALCDVPLNRMHTWRTSMTAVAFTLVKTTYHLEGNDVEERTNQIKSLMHFGGSYAYTFAFKRDSDGKEDARTPDKTKPYLLPIFSDVIRPFFAADKGSYRKETQERFKSSDGGYYEMPQALVALSATLVYAALDFLEKGRSRDSKNPFQCHSYQEAYDGNMFQLDDIKSRFPEGYHRLLQRIYEDVTGSAVRAPKPAFTTLTETDIESIELD